MPQYYPVDAGQLLFGPLTQFLQQYGQEKRGRQERMGREERARAERQEERSELRRRYETRMQMEQDRIRRQQAAQAHAGVMEEMRTGTPETAPVALARAAELGYPMAQHGGTTEPTPMAVPVMAPEAGGGMAPVPELIPMRPERAGMPPGEGIVYGRPEEALPELEMGSAPPTQPLFRQFLEAHAKREEKAGSERSIEAGRTAVDDLKRNLLADPTGEGAALAYDLDVEGIVPDKRDDILASSARGSAELARQAYARRPRHAPRRPERVQGNRIKSIIRQNSYSKYRTVVKAGGLMEVPKDSTEAEIQSAFQTERGAYETDAKRKLGDYKDNKRMKKWGLELRVLEKQAAGMFPGKAKKKLGIRINNLIGNISGLGSKLDEARITGSMAVAPLPKGSPTSYPAPQAMGMAGGAAPKRKPFRMTPALRRALSHMLTLDEGAQAKDIAAIRARGGDLPSNIINAPNKKVRDRIIWGALKR